MLKNTPIYVSTRTYLIPAEADNFTTQILKLRTQILLKVNLVFYRIFPSSVDVQPKSDCYQHYMDGYKSPGSYFITLPYPAEEHQHVEAYCEEGWTHILRRSAEHNSVGMHCVPNRKKRE